MISKAVTILAIATACYGIPIEEQKPEVLPQSINVATPAESAPAKPELTLPVEEKPYKPELVVEKAPLEQPALIAVAADEKIPTKPEESDLKTDNTIWWKSYYRYPVYSKYYYDYQYVPRTYTYYAPRTYSYWSSYW